MRIAILASRPDGWHARDLLRAAAEAGVEASVLDWRRLEASLGGDGPPWIGCGAIDLLGMDAVLARAMPGGSLEQVVFRMDALGRLEAAGIAVVNPARAIEAAVDKYLALSRIAAAGAPVPRTRCAQSARDALRGFDELGGRAVVKPLFGSGGVGIVLLEDREVAGRAFRALERTGAAIYQQEFVPHPGGDLRVLVIGGEAVLGMRRRPAAGVSGSDRAEWRANIARGGRAEAHEPTSREADLAVRAAAALGAEVAGVDLLPAEDGRLLVSEVNSSPGWRALSRVTGTDVARRVIELVRKKPRRG